MYNRWLRLFLLCAQTHPPALDALQDTPLLHSSPTQHVATASGSRADREIANIQDCFLGVDYRLRETLAIEQSPTTYVEGYCSEAVHV